MNKHIDTLFNHCKVDKIYGTAGSGKTTELIKRLKVLIDGGVSPKRIAFVSFTNKAVDELIERCLEEFKQFDKDYFKYFKTIHSICYHEITNKKIISREELVMLAKQTGLKISLLKEIEDSYGMKKGDNIRSIDSLSRLRMISLKQQWEELGLKDCPYFLVKEWSDNLKKYKDDNDIIDFTDMLQQYNTVLDIDYMFIDEAQDLSPLQWHVMNIASKDCKKVIIAGDDDQLIFNWAGADVNYILDIKCDTETILSKSYRLPTKIYNMSREILKRISKRKPKESKPVVKMGSVDYAKNFESIDLCRHSKYLILVRNRHQIFKIKKELEKRGRQYSLFGKNSISEKKKEIFYDYFVNCKYIDGKGDKYLYSEDRDYIIQVLKKEGNKSFQEDPKIKISTIHQAKGGECENVILFTDVSHTIWKNINTDAEHKVWYVAITRCKRNLTIVREQSNRFYKI